MGTEIRNTFKGVGDAVDNIVNPIKKAFSDIYNAATTDLKKIGDWLSAHSPFRLIEGAMNRVEALAHRIHGNSINTIVAADLKKVNTPAENMRKNLSSALEGGFRDGVNASKTHTQALVNQVKKTSEDIAPTGGGGIRGAISSAAAMIKSTIDSLPSLDSLKDRVSGFFSNIQTFGESLLSRTNIFEVLKGTLTFFTDRMRDNLIVGVRGLVTVYNEFSKEMEYLNRLPTFDLTLQRTGERLGIKNTLRIERAALNMQFNINIKIDAGDVTEALYNFKNNNRSNAKGTFSDTAFNPGPPTSTAE